MKTTKIKIAKNIAAVVLGASIPALAVSTDVPKAVQLGANVVLSLGLLHARAPKDE